MTSKDFFVGNAQLAIAGTGGHDHDAGGVLVSCAVGDNLDRAGEIDVRDVITHELRAEALGLLAQVMPSGKPGKFSTSVVFISAPPAVTEPSNTSGARLARAA